MPALPADIAAASRDVVTATWADPAIAARYPSSRDGSISPADAYFDAIGDAQVIANERGALIGVERRRFAAEIYDLVWPDLTAGLPQARLVDGEQGAIGPFLVARIEIDLEAEVTTDELFG